MELKQLEYIVKIAEERNVTKAAEKTYRDRGNIYKKCRKDIEHKEGNL